MDLNFSKLPSHIEKHDVATPIRGKNLKNYQMIHTSCKSESSNISLVILDKLLFGFQSPKLIKQYKLGHIGPVTIWILVAVTSWRS